MSTILKALQRLEDEKSADSDRSLDEQVVARRPPPQRERRWLKIGVVAVGVLGVAAAASWFWPSSEDPVAEVAVGPPPPAAAPAAAETERKVAAEKPRRKTSNRRKSAKRVQQDSPEVAVSPVVEVVQRLDAPLDDSAVSPKRAAPPAETGPKRPAARRRKARKPEPKVALQPDSEAALEVNSEVASAAVRPNLEPKKVAADKPAVTSASEDSAPAKPLSAPPAPVEIAAVAPEPVPAAEPEPRPAAVREPERRVVKRANFPRLSVEKTIWHPDTTRRVAIVKLVDGEDVVRLKEGDAVGPLVVKAIKPSGVLFNHDGVEIQFDVGG